MSSLVPMVEPQSLPLADYFFICGLETSRLFETAAVSGLNGNLGRPSSPNAEDIIDEDGPYNADSDQRPTSSQGTSEGTRRRARFSYEARKSITSVANLESVVSGSNRSSATIRAVQPEKEQWDEQGFLKALQTFATERDAFLGDIKGATMFSSGQVAQPTRPRPQPKMQRIGGDDKKGDKTVGSMRRRISTMNPLSRQNTSSGHLSSRQSKRISGYNAVTPLPQRFKPSPEEHPLKRPYEPVLLDKYPAEDQEGEQQRRNKFPDFVPMFVFPNDIRMVASDTRPRSTWHGFTMTGGTGEKQYGMCLIAWMPLPETESDALEQQCNEWKDRFMSKEEREMAESLSIRLASARAKLSDLLGLLPSVPYGTPERDKLDDDISEIEDKIHMMVEALQPVRHAGKSKIDGLTDGTATGFWVPRAYGVLGRDGGLTSFWKEWLRAVAIPITHGVLLNVPLSSPNVGVWQPLERYVINLCTEAPSPLTSKVQVQLTVRELSMFARKEAENEIPGSRSTDLYALFRCLDISNIIVLFEYVLSESRIILLSSHTSTLHLVSAAITQLLWPMKWHGAYVPVLPARLVQMLDAPCPYIFGIERRYENVELPSDDFVLVDLDNSAIEATSPPISLPRAQRRKLLSILQLAAPHHNRYGVPLGPPPYAVDAYPSDTFPSENASLFEQYAPSSNMAYLANLSSGNFGVTAASTKAKPPPLNVFLQTPAAKRKQSLERPTTASTNRTGSPPSPSASPTTASFPRSMMNGHSVGRNDSAYALQSSLREKRSGRLEQPHRRNSTFGIGSALRRPSLGLSSHQSTTSVSTVGTESIYGGSSAMSTYAPSIYATSTLAASTIMPQQMMQPVRNTQQQMWTEGHCLQLKPPDGRNTCAVCDIKIEESLYRCNGCGMVAHGGCTEKICLVCPAAFHPEQIMAAFARLFASLFYTYRKSLSHASSEQKKTGQLYYFDRDHFVKNNPSENSTYIRMLLDTQGFNEFIHDITTRPQSDPQIHLFDSFIAAKRSRGRPNLFSRSASVPNGNGSTTGKNTGGFLGDKSNHLWATASAPLPKNAPGEQGSNEKRFLPGRLDPQLLVTPRVVNGVPQPRRGKKGIGRKAVPSTLNPDLQAGSGSTEKAGSRLKEYVG